jgi:hypothetical protein
MNKKGGVNQKRLDKIDFFLLLYKSGRKYVFDSMGCKKQII